MRTKLHACGTLITKCNGPNAYEWLGEKSKFTWLHET